MIGLDAVYLLAGLMFGAFALQHALDAAAPRRWANTAFWGAYAATFLFGSALPDAVATASSCCVMVVLAGLGRIGGAKATAGTPEERRAGALRFGNRLFVPALVIPAVALLGTLFLKDATLGGRPIVDPKQVTLVSLALGVLVALAVAYALLRPPARRAADGGAAADRRHGLGGGAAAAAGGARRGVRSWRASARRWRRSSPTPSRSTTASCWSPPTRSAWRCSRW